MELNCEPVVCLELTPMGKPRMSRQDTWKKRPPVQRFWEYKQQIRDSVFLPMIQKILKQPFFLIFALPIPKSWSKKKKLLFDCQPQKGKPDKDNLEKGFLDSALDEDKYCWAGTVVKLWLNEPIGRIILTPVWGDHSFDLQYAELRAILTLRNEK